MKNFIKSVRYLILLSLLISLHLKAQGSAGNSSANELLIPVNAKGMALSGANIASISGLDAVYYNPAGINELNSDIEAMFSYMNYIADIDLSYAATGFTFEGIGTFAASVRNLEFGDIPITTVQNPYGTGEYFSPTFVIAGVSYSRKISDNFAVGLNVNYITETIMQSDASGVGFDIGLQLEKIFSLRGIKFGAVLRNLGSTMQYDGADLLSQRGTEEGGVPFIKYDTPEFDLPLLIDIGVAYDKKITEFYGISLSSSFQTSQYRYDELKIGGEFNYDNILFVRGGYTYTPEAADDSDLNIFGPTFGAGIQLETVFNIFIEYGYRDTEYFSANHMMSMKLGF